jgi:transaldolase
MARSRLTLLHDHGQSVWLDLLSRALVRSGELASLIADDSVTGLTSNPTIFSKALSSGDDDTDIAALFERTHDARATFFALAVGDVQEACDLLAPVHVASDGADGFVSLELDPGLARDAQASIAQAVELHQKIDRANAYIKIPATVEGLEAIEACTARGISINVTLIFAVERYRAVIAAYQHGLRRLIEGGGNPRSVASVASFFVSRLDTQADAQLESAGRNDLAGRLGIASARLAYAEFLDAFAGPAWAPLAAAGARKQLPLWASTSTKNPAYPDLMYVEELVGPETVNTMPPETLAAFRDHGEVRGDTINEGLEQARALGAELDDAGVLVAEVTAQLERDGVARFAASFAEILELIDAKRAEVADA